MEPYEGRKPYIFISYARKDKERVEPFLKAMSGADYRVWYDVGISAGDPWRKELLDKISGCKVFCPLFSQAFNASFPCFVETAWAYQNDKKIVPLYLEELDTESLGQLYRLLQELQDLRLYQFDSPAQFAKRVKQEQAFALCKVPEWKKVGQIQWRFVDGLLSIARNEDWPWKFASIPSYQYDIVYRYSTAPWATYREEIFSVEIADDIDVIGDCAFYCCYNLTNVHIPDKVTAIGNRAFQCCLNLTDVRIPDSVTEIGNWAFDFCASLTDVLIPDSVIKIGYQAFSDCYKLKSAEIPAGAEVDVGAFPTYTRITWRDAPNGNKT